MLSLLACALPPPPPPTTAARDAQFAEHGTLSMVEGEIFTLPPDLQLGWSTHDPDVVEVAGTQLLATGMGRSHLQLRRGGQTHVLDVQVAALLASEAPPRPDPPLPRHALPSDHVSVAPDPTGRLILGTLDAALVDRQVHAAMPRIEACFNLPDVLVAAPPPFGTFVWKLVIDAHGDVRAVTSGSGLTPQDPLSACVSGVLRGLDLAPSRVDGVALVHYSFIAT